MHADRHTQSSKDTQQAVPAGQHPPLASLPRRLGAIVYDSLLLAGVLFTASALALLLAVAVLGSDPVKAHNPLLGNPFFATYIFFVWFFFYAWFWIHGGQTLGMRAWKIRVQRVDGGPISWWQALLRFLLAGLWILPVIYLNQVLSLSLGYSLAGGFGFLLLILAGRLHDRYSETLLVHVKPPS